MGDGGGVSGGARAREGDEACAAAESARTWRRVSERDLRYGFACTTDALTHDLKNLVGAALMSLRAFSTRRGAAPGEGAEFFDDALRSLEQGVQTLDRMRRSLDVPAGGGPADVAEAARAAAALLEPAWPPGVGPVRVELEPGRGAPLDDDELTHVFFHLFERAAAAFARAGRPGAIVVAPCPTPEGWPPDSVSFVVRDDGPALRGEAPPADPFDPFDPAALDLGRARLGLAIVKYLVENAGGEVQLAREGDETLVRCHLPPPSGPDLPLRLTRS
ncbi:MAG TPA: ATP-binding protein [Polyangiaceae bacterium]|nr:ATP-binding protein [Polyangiaceae bacterium]